MSDAKAADNLEPMHMQPRLDHEMRDWLTQRAKRNKTTVSAVAADLIRLGREEVAASGGLLRAATVAAGGNRE